MISKEQLSFGVRFALPTRPDHFFRLDGFARPAREGECSKWTDGGVRYAICLRDEATHVHGWESYACFPSMERMLAEAVLENTA